MLIYSVRERLLLPPCTDVGGLEVTWVFHLISGDLFNSFVNGCLPVGLSMGYIFKYPFVYIFLFKNEMANDFFFLKKMIA